MTLKKGFLRPKEIIDRYNLTTGIAIGTTSSFALFGVFYFFRETIRLLAPSFTDSLIELSPQQVFYWNLFYGAIAAVFGLHIIIKVSIEDLSKYSNRKLAFRHRQGLNDQNFIIWTFLFAFAKLTTLLGVWYLCVPMQYDIDFLTEFPLLLILVPFVLFLSIWLVLVRTYKRNGYKWMLYSFLYITILSLFYANINFIDYRNINQFLKAKYVDLSHQMSLPESQSYGVLHRHLLALDIYVLNNSIYWNKEKNSILIEDVKNRIAEEKYRISEYGQNDLTANLIIDEHVQLGLINNLKSELRKANILKIQYSTGAKNSKYPPNYPLFKYVGIQQVLFPYYPEIVSFLDSAENLDFKKFTVRIPESHKYRVQGLKNINHVELKVEPKKVLFNRNPVSDERLQKVIYALVKKYSPNFVIIYNPGETITYRQYIKYLDLVYTTIYRLRDEMSLELYNHPFEPGYGSEKNRSIIETYPLNVLEWTPEEKRLIRLMKKAGLD